MAKQTGRIYVDPEIGDVQFCKSTRSSRMSIRVHPDKGVRVMVPYVIPYSVAQMFFQARRQWVIDTMARQNERYKDVRKLSEDEAEAMRRQAKEVLPPRLAELAERYGFSYNRVVIKHNVSNWGSCSSKGNINLNLNILRLPKVLQDYILLHELCHLKHQDHGHAFHLLLEHVLTDNLMHLLEQEPSASDPESAGHRALAAELARRAAASKARYPLDHVMTREIKTYRIA